MSVERIMTRKPIYIAPTAKISEAIEILHELDIRHLPVVDDGTLVGILSEKDVQAHVLPITSELAHPEEAASRLGDPVSKVMSGGVLSVTPESDLSEVIELLLENKISAVPVVNPLEGNLVGIVSYVDLLEEMRALLEP